MLSLTDEDTSYQTDTGALEPTRKAELTLPVVENQAVLKEHLPKIQLWIDNQIVRVEGDSFKMGCTPEKEECAPDEYPVQLAGSIATFEISKCKTTQKLWETVMGHNSNAFDDCPRCPVETVS